MSVCFFCVYWLLSCFVFFFFFQAEDGIRDWSVTGVQTCALPILKAAKPRARTTEPMGTYDGTGVALARTSDTSQPTAMPIMPPTSVSVAASTRNCHRISRRVAPKIGRASCRERAWSTGGANELEIKES